MSEAVAIGHGAGQLLLEALMRQMGIASDEPGAREYRDVESSVMEDFHKAALLLK